ATNFYLIWVCPPLPLGTQNGPGWSCFAIDEPGGAAAIDLSVRPGYPGFLWLLHTAGSTSVMSSGSDTVHSNRTNAIMGALLGTLLFVQTVRIIDESFSAPEKPHAEASHKTEAKEAAAAP